MGKTWAWADRKKFGKQRIKNHRSRSKWGQKNGGRGIAPRLRTLTADITEFRFLRGVVPESQQTPPTDPKSLNGIGYSLKTLYDGLTTTELKNRIVFYTKQCQFITAMARGASDTGDLISAKKIRDEKGDFLVPEMNAIRLYLERFR